MAVSLLRNHAVSTQSLEFKMDRSWLGKCVVIDPKRMGFRVEVEDDDIVYEFCSPPESWAVLAGRKGYALVRDGEIIDSIITELN
jgi:hypothetical protein